MLQKPKECQNCVLGHYKNSGFSNPEGTCKNGVLIIGEGLGINEVQDGLPFRPYAESGSALQTAFNKLKRFGINQERSDFGLWNLISCQPPYNKLEGASYEEDAILTCRTNYFDKVIDYYKPKVILALGNLPLKWLVPEIRQLQDELKAKIKEAKINKDKELTKHLESQLYKKLTISALRGYKFDSIYGIPLVPSFHPSYITRTGRILLGVLHRDLMFALELAEGKWEDYKFENYCLKPSIEDAWRFYEYCKSNPDLAISYDIETPYTKLEVDESEIDFGTEVRDIDSIQFSIMGRATNNRDNRIDEKIENAENKIQPLLQVASKSIFLDWDGDFLEIIRSILQLSNPKVGWNNWKFDETNLKYHLGGENLKGIRYDAMWLWKHFNADFRQIGRALQFAANFQVPNVPAWKHTSDSDPRKYGLIDVDITLKTFLSLKSELSAAKLDVPKAKTIFQGYEDDIVKLYPILQAMSKRGFPTNLKATEEFRAELEEKRRIILDELQELYPTELRRPDPKLGYKIVPKEVGLLELEFENKYCDFSSPDFLIFLDEKTRELALSRFIESNTRRKDDEHKGQTGLIVRNFKLEDGQIVKRYCRLDRFKPGSKLQVEAYLKYKGYKSKDKNKKKGQKPDNESTDKNALYDLYQEYKDEFLLMASYERELRKIVSTYIDGWTKDKKRGLVFKDEDGRVHAEFKFLPSTGQLSCSPNIQNSPSHGTRFSSKDYVRLANKFRSTIRPKSEHTLLSFDYVGFHAIMLGLEAEDNTYIRLAKLDAHSYLAAHMLRKEYSSKRRSFDIKLGLQSLGKSEKDKLRSETLEWIDDLDNWLSYDDNKLLEKLNWIKKNHKLIRDAQAKPAIHGTGFGMQPRKFYTLNKQAFSSMAEAESVLTLFMKLFPKLFIWQEYIMNLAHEQTYLISRYGYIRRFWDVYDFRLLKEFRAPKDRYEKIIKTKDGKWWSRRLGGQSKEAIAFLPANNAFAKKKEAMHDLEELGLLEKYILINDLHDDLLFECPDEFVEEAILIVKEIMERPTRHISTGLYPEGISCPVGVKLGKNWGPFNDDKNRGELNLDGMKGYKI